VNTEEALRVADKVADRELSWADHPSMVNMIYALEILANDYRTMQEKAQAWERSYRDRTYAHDQRARKLRDARDTVQRLNELVEFMRTALGLDAHALDDPDRARKILGGVFADARLWARVKNMAGGKFVAGDVVTADVMNAVSEAVKSSRETDMGTMESLTVKPAAAEPRKFAAGSREPGQVKRVGRVDRPDVTFTRMGLLPNGNGVWRRDGEAALLEWAHMVKFVPVVEIR